MTSKEIPSINIPKKFQICQSKMEKINIIMWQCSCCVHTCVYMEWKVYHKTCFSEILTTCAFTIVLVLSFYFHSHTHTHTSFSVFPQNLGSFFSCLFLLKKHTKDNNWMWVKKKLCQSKWKNKTFLATFLV